MSGPAVNLGRLFELVAAVCDEDATQDELVELNSIMLTDREACRRYQRYCRMHSALRVELRAHQAAQAVCQQISIAPVISEADESHVTKAKPPVPAFTAPFLPTVLHGATIFFSSGWPAAYLIATVICGIAILIGSLIRVSPPGEVAKHAPSVVEGRAAPELHPTPIGQITGMVDCRWAAHATEPAFGASVFLGHKYSLASGLMEITYDTGAKVILQGPVTYEVESAAGGYLSLGKLTARLEKSEIRNPKSETISKSPNLQISKFSVRTPTATVTDLGTEFGVEVSKEGHTISHVFRGTVKVQYVGAGAEKAGSTFVLQENESLLTGRGDPARGPAAVVRRINVDPQTFVRRISKPAKTLDLLDIVAGGDGTGRHRERGIDPGTGREDGLFVAEGHDGDGRYRPVALHKLIDGVFIPDGRRQPVVLDSAGRTFADFPPTSGASYGLIWARAADLVANGAGQGNQFWIYRLGRGDQFMPNHRGLLGMHANAGITFNLEAMRKLTSGSRPARFRAFAGVAQANCLTYTANFDHDLSGWHAASLPPFYSSTGGQDGGGYVGAMRLGFYPYLSPPANSILCGDLAANFGSHVIKFSYYLKNFSGTPGDGGRLMMFANAGGDASGETIWLWTPSDTSAPHEWRQYTWTVDTTANATPASWSRVSGTGSWADSWKHVKEWTFWAGQGSGQIVNGIDTVVASGVSPTSPSPERNQLANIWVFVDGQLKLKRLQLRPTDGVVPVDVEIGPGDRFLTLVSTDGGNGNWLDWVVFGDPVLDLLAVERDKL